MVSKCKYVITDTAKEELYGIFDYITYKLSNHSSAIALYERIISSINLICSFPESCPIAESDKAKENQIRKLLVDSYVVLYKYSKESSTITIIRVIYAKRDLNELLRELYKATSN